MRCAVQEMSSSHVYPYGPKHSSETIFDLARRAYEYRIQVLRMVYGRGSGHIGGTFSAAEILTALYVHQLRLDPANPAWEDRDRLVFSKGHACAMLYTVLAHRGILPVDGNIRKFRFGITSDLFPPRLDMRGREFYNRF